MYFIQEKLFRLHACGCDLYLTGISQQPPEHTDGGKNPRQNQKTLTDLLEKPSLTSRREQISLREILVEPKPCIFFSLECKTPS